MFHINQDGLPKPCSAQSPQNCPYYQPHLKTHFANIEDAQEEADLIFSGEERLKSIKEGEIIHLEQDPAIRAYLNHSAIPFRGGPLVIEDGRKATLSLNKSLKEGEGITFSIKNQNWTIKAEALNKALIEKRLNQAIASQKAPQPALTLSAFAHQVISPLTDQDMDNFCQSLNKFLPISLNEQDLEQTMITDPEGLLRYFKEQTPLLSTNWQDIVQNRREDFYTTAVMDSYGRPETSV